MTYYLNTMSIKKAKTKKSSGIDREKLGKKAAKVKAETKYTKSFIEKWYLFALLVVILIPTVLIGVSFGKNLGERGELLKEREKIVEELIYWQNVANTHKGYRDAHFKIAVLEYKLNNIEQAKAHLEKTLMLDPNFEPAIKFRKLL